LFDSLASVVGKELQVRVVMYGPKGDLGFASQSWDLKSITAIVNGRLLTDELGVATLEDYLQPS
jgi:hypothetical protein